MKKIFEINSLEELHLVAEYIFELIKKGGTFFCLNGEMGAGKTTLMSRLSSQLKITDPISSPTFPIINEYFSESLGKIFHMDLYRLKNEEEAIDIGIEDIIYNGEYCFVEWSERILNLLPDSYVQVNKRP